MSNSNEKIKKFIAETVIEKEWSNKAFKKKYEIVFDKFYDSYPGIIKRDHYPDPRTIRNWCNGKNCPDHIEFPIIAKVLEVDILELILGQKIPYINDYKTSVENQETINLITKLLFSKLVFSNFIALVLFLLGLLFLNISSVNNIYINFIIVLLIAFKTIIFLIRKQKSKWLIRLNKNDYITVKKYIKEKTIVSYILILLFFTIGIILLLPGIESLFYSGSFYITAVIYIIISLLIWYM